MLTEGVYPYEYTDSWKKFDETSLPEKEDFYSNLNIEDITDVDYKHAKKVWKGFEIKNLGVYHDLFVQENFRNKCIEIYELDPAHFLSAPGLAWQACFKKTNVKLELLTDIDMLLVVEKGIRVGICLTKKFFFENLLATETEKIKVKMNKPVYLG